MRSAVGAPQGATPFEVPGDPAALAAFSSRADGGNGSGNVSLQVGDGRPQAARGALLGAVGLDPGCAVFMEQVHGRDVAVVGPNDGGRGSADHSDAIPGVDALVTFDTDLALVVMVADCVPVLLVDPGSGAAAVHAGRRGVELGVVGAAVATLAPHAPDALHAIIGPAIGGCCYEVPASLADEVADAVPEAAATTSWGTAALDLPAGVRAQLRGAGVGRIAEVGSCTHCHPDRWFSHRAEPGQGRQAGVVVRRSAPTPPPQDRAPRSLHWGV